MISREAISYDLHETRATLASGQAAEAHRQLDRIIEDLKFMLRPSGGRRSKDSPASDEVRRKDMETLFTLCDQARAAIARSDKDLALIVLHDAKRFWDTLPDNRKTHRLDELLRQLQKARLHASAREQEEAKFLIDEIRVTINAMWFADGDKSTQRAARAHVAEAGLSIVMRDFTRSVLALDSAIRILERER